MEQGLNMDIVGLWVAIGVTIFIFSFLYKDNPFYKLAEHTFVGLTVGYQIVRVIYDVMINKLWEPLAKDYEFTLVIPSILGIFIIFRFIPAVSWLSRWSFAFIVGVGSGMTIPRQISFFFQQVQATMKPLFGEGLDFISWGDSVFSRTLILVAVVSVIIYFFFSIEHKKVTHGIAKIGIWFLMVSFGAAFGYTVMARESLLIGRLLDLFDGASKESGYATLFIIPIVVVCVIIWEVFTKRSEEKNI